MTEAAQLLFRVIDWLRDDYGSRRFFVERDIVWTIQLRLIRLIAEASLDLRVLHEFHLGSERRVDLAVISPEVELALEVKYEPDHSRDDIISSKLPVASWYGVAGDVARIHEVVERGWAKTACSLFIDEGGHFRGRAAPAGSAWHRWGERVWALTAFA